MHNNIKIMKKEIIESICKSVMNNEKYNKIV